MEIARHDHDGVAFQPAVAGALDDVVEAMRSAHDSLVLSWGPRRTSSVWWHLYGPPIAGLMARRAFGGRGPNPVQGPWPDGLEALKGLLTGSTADDGIDDETYLTELVAWAQPYARPTLILAYANVWHSIPQGIPVDG